MSIATQSTDARTALLASIVDCSDDAIIAKTPEGIITSWNRGAERIYGYSASEITGEPMSMLIPPDRPDEMEGILARIRDGERVEHYETVRLRKDGKVIAISLTVSPIYDWEGKLVGVSSIARDITERARAGEKLRTASLYARSLIEASVDPLVTISPQGKITDVNEATIKVTGIEREKLIGTDFSDYFTEPEKAREGYQQVFSEGSVTDYPLTIRHRDGRITDVLYNASVYKDPHGEVLGVFAAARDVTAQKQASQYARSLVEASLDPLVTISPEGRITDVNEATIQVTGVDRGKLIGTDFSNYFTEPEKARKGYQQVFSLGLVTDYPLTIRHRSGRLTQVLYNASVYKDVRGNVLGVFAAARDVPEIRRLNRELQARVGELTALNQELESFNYSISHDLRAPLRHMDGFSKILIEEHGTQIPEAARRYLDLICQGARRMGRMVDELLELSRTSRKDLARQPTMLQSLVDEVLAELRPELDGHQIEWRMGELPLADCDPSLTRQVFVNLLSNAVKFSRPRKPAVIEVGQSRRQGQTVLFVRDNGVGFSMKYAGKLFGVFQRLHRREDFEGTGVGLATAQRIIQKHGGRIWAEAELDKGATFYFTLEPPGEPGPSPEPNEETAVIAGGR